MAPLKIRQAEQREPGKSRRQHSSRCADGLPKARFPKGRGSLVLDGPRTLLFAWIPRVMEIISVILGDADRRGPQRLLVLDADADGQVGEAVRAGDIVAHDRERGRSTHCPLVPFNPMPS